MRSRSRPLPVLADGSWYRMMSQNLTRQIKNYVDSALLFVVLWMVSRRNDLRQHCVSKSRLISNRTELRKRLNVMNRRPAWAIYRRGGNSWSTFQGQRLAFLCCLIAVLRVFAAQRWMQ